MLERLSVFMIFDLSLCFLLIGIAIAAQRYSQKDSSVALSD